MKSAIGKTQDRERDDGEDRAHPRRDAPTAAAGVGRSPGRRRQGAGAASRCSVAPSDGLTDGTNEVRVGPVSARRGGGAGRRMRRDAHSLAASPRPVPGRAVVAAVVAGTHRLDRRRRHRAAAGRRDRASSLGFDFELLIEAGRDVAAGRSPYAAGAGRAAAAPTGDAASSTPTRRPSRRRSASWRGDALRVVFVLWSIVAVVGLLAVAECCAAHWRRSGPGARCWSSWRPCAPLTLPFAVGLLFGNLDVWFPLLYGAMLLAAVGPGARHGGGWRRRPGVAAREAAPGIAGPLVPGPGVPRWPRGRAGSSARSRSVAAAAVVAAVASSSCASIVLGGTTVWAEYADVVRAGARATIVDPRQCRDRRPDRVVVVGADDAFARSLHVVVAVAALVVTVWAAWRRPDPVESFAWATAASLATLPVTWYHYPSAMLPIAVAAMLRASGPDTRRVSLLVAAGAVVAAVIAGLVAAAWVAVGAHRGCGAGVGTGAFAGRAAESIRQGRRLPQPDDREQDHPRLDPDHRQRQPDRDRDGPATSGQTRRRRR